MGLGIASVLLAVICLSSGAAGLIFETVWFHRAGLVLGSSVWSTSMVLSSFMAGLTVGAAVVARYGSRITRLLHGYAAAEATVADARPLAKNGYKVPLTRAVVRRTLAALASGG